MLQSFRMPPPVCHLQAISMEMRVLPMQTRMPFRYGIAELRQLPHLFLQAEVKVEGKRVFGVASESLPPKWFTKNPRSSFEADLADMLAVISHAVRLTPLLCREPMSFFDFWKTLQKEHGHWAFTLAHPPLLWQLGASLVERALLDAVCRALGHPLHKVVKAGALGVDWNYFHPGLKDHAPEKALPGQPLPEVSVRHTVGMADPLVSTEIPDAERLDDGLPQALDECIAAYGLRYFKIKVSGNLDEDATRLRKIETVLGTACGQDYAVTIDGNENFATIEAFRAWYDKLSTNAGLRQLFEKTLWIEQPVHRDRALEAHIQPALDAWKDGPPIIIDESDGGTGDAHRALKLGYSGTSHKNCKGILKGLANAALLQYHRRLHPRKTFIQSGEDLVNVGPIAAMKDLAAQAMLGISHVERNGHHYFRGLSMFSPEVNAQACEAHPDLYAMQPDGGFATLQIKHGKLDLTSVNEAPFGAKVDLDLTQFPTVKDWIMQGGLQVYA